MWNYAKLSKMAKALGGPEKLVNTIFDAGLKKGRWQMLPIALVGIPVGYGISKLVDFFKKKKQASDEELEAAKQELIRGIQEYDRNHPEAEQ